MPKIKKVTQVEVGERHSKNIDAAFVAFTTTTVIKGIAVPVVLMQSRTDNKIGFPGGKVEENETLTEAAQREVKEEINANVATSDITLRCSHAIGKKMHTHLFTCEVTPEQMIKMIKKSTKAEHFGMELGGCFMAFLSVPGIEVLKNTPSASSVQEEIDVLLEIIANSENN